MRLLDLGRKEYGEVWELQRRLVAKRAAGEIEDTLVLVEHELVITLGRKTSPENFKPQEIPVFQVERGGDATLHAPGQLVGYPIVKLATPNVQRFVRDIEEVIILATRSFGLDSGRLEGHPGVWVGGRKVASIGVAVTNWVTYHGFALNVSNDLAHFRLIKPCGLDPERMASMERVLGRPVQFAEVKAEVVRRFEEVFGCRLEAPHEGPHLTSLLT